jgi:hypothetical protein
MSDRPLFENQDAQERVYAPQELPAETDGRREASIEEAGRGTGGVEGGAIIPGAGVGMGGLGTAPATTAGGGGAAPVVGAVVAGETLSTNEDRDDDGVVETGESRRS